MFRCPSTVATSAALILIFLASAQAAWMNKVSNVANVMAITADNEGSVFIGGRCLGDCPFFHAGGGSSVSYLNASQTGGAAFVAKYYNNGTFVWHVRIDGALAEWILSLAANSVGDVIATVQYASNPLTIFDIRNNPVTTFSLVSANSGLLLSLASNGTFNWGVRATSTVAYTNSVERFTTVAVGPQDEVIVIARYLAANLAIYDSSRTLSATIASTGQSDILVAKFTQSGVLVWWTRFGGSDNGVISNAAVDVSGDVLATSESTATISVREQAGKTTTVSAGSGGYVYLVKLSGVNGSFIWSTRMLSGSAHEKISAVKTDSLGNVFTCGYFTSTTVDIEDVSTTGIQTLTNSDTGAGYLVKYDSNGRYKWAIGFDGLNEDRCSGLVVDSSDNVIMIGQSLSSPTPVTITQNTALRAIDCQGIATFMAKFDPDGSILWTAAVDGLIDDTPSGIAVDISDNVYVVGLSISPAVSITDGQLRQLGRIDLITLTDAWFFKLEKNETFFATAARVTMADIRITLPKNEPAVGTVSAGVSTSSNAVSTPEAGRLANATNSNAILTYIIVGSSTGFVILVGLIAYVCSKRCSKRRRGYGGPDDTMQGLKSNLTSVNTASAMTALMSNHELSIPAFLQMNFGTDFRQEEFIAKGGGGSLYTCSWLSLDLADMCKRQPLALKLVSERSIDELPDRIKTSFFQEIAIMYKFRDHPLLCKVYAFSIRPVTMVMKLYELGDLDHYIAGNGLAIRHFPYTKRRVTELIYNLSNAIAFMHQSGLAHCDIKPSNALLEARMSMNRTLLIPVLIDFGVSRIISEDALQVRGFEVSEIVGASASFASPEVWNRLRRRSKNVKDPNVWKAGDTYALAITMLTMMSRRTPWPLKKKKAKKF